MQRPVYPSSGKFSAATVGMLLLFAIDRSAMCASGQGGGALTNGTTSAASSPKVPDLRELIVSFKTNEMRAVAQRYQADRGNLTRYYNVPIAPERCQRLKWFGEEWLAAVEHLDLAGFGEDARAERTRLLESIRRDLRQAEEQAGS